MKYIEIAPSHHSGGAIVFGANPYTLEPLGEGGYNVGLIHDTAPSAVKIADAIDTIICAINFMVSFFVIIQFFKLDMLVNSLFPSCHLDRTE